VHNFTVHLVGEDGAPVEAQVVQAHNGMCLEDVFDEIYELKLEGRLRTEMLIVRMPVDEQWGREEIENKTTEKARSLFDSKETSGAFGRLRDRSVHVLASSGGSHVLTSNLSPHWADDPMLIYGLSIEAVLIAIRRAEFNFILERSRAILTSPPGSQFRAPSGRLVKSFVRVGNIQYNRDAIDAVFFWLLPHLVGVRAILTDTWSISSIGFNLARLSSRYFGLEYVPVEMLPSYHDGSEAATIQTRAVVERLDADLRAASSDRSNMLCLISATQTGSLASHLQHIFDSSSLSCEPRFVALFALGNTEIPSLHNLHGDGRFALLSEDAAPLSQPVIIDSQVYFPLQFQDEVIEINKSIADISRQFFDCYVTSGIIQVHRTHDEGNGRPRHHGIHLETERLLEVPQFVTRYDEVLGSLPSCPSVIVCPPHKAGHELARHAQQRFGGAGSVPKIYEHPNLFLQPTSPNSEEQELRDFLNGAKESDALLVVDDVCITGTRLSQYQRYIRTERYKGRIDYVIGVSRVSHPDVWTNLQRYLSYRGRNPERHTVKCVDALLLPDWRDEDCPWCREMRLYERWQKESSLPDALVDRLTLLSRASASGMTDELYLRFPDLPTMKLGPDSLFTSDRANQAEVFAAVSSALQHLRSNSSGERPPLGPRRFPISTVLNHVDYLRSKWTDSILRATFLRSASSEELTYAAPDKEKERTQALRDLAIQQTDGEHEVALELLLAAHLGKCSISVDQEIASVVEAFGSAELTSYLINRLLAMDKP
jgi:hypothetical protein